jgi:hypothetical protein
MNCSSGKRRHKSRAAARAFARRYPGVNRRAYQCEHCGAWHLGRLTQASRSGQDAA